MFRRCVFWLPGGRVCDRPKALLYSECVCRSVAPHISGVLGVNSGVMALGGLAACSAAGAAVESESSWLPALGENKSKGEGTEHSWASSGKLCPRVTGAAEPTGASKSRAEAGDRELTRVLLRGAGGVRELCSTSAGAAGAASSIYLI